MSKAMPAQRKAENTLIAAYDALAKAGHLQDDHAQRAVLKEMAALCDVLERRKRRRILPGHTGEAPGGFYLHGSVGTGKSMLMDLFHAHLRVTAKRREHFHAFMLDIHARLDGLRRAGESDPIVHAAKAIARETPVLCLDELQVTDIADAMILGRLFGALFKEGITLIATSNRAPEELYKDGLQRDRFLPFIAMLKTRMRVMALNGGRDYRLELARHLATLYFTPLGKKADRFLKDTFASLTHAARPVPRTLNAQGRTLTIEKTHGGVAWASFRELCEAALGPADYLEIARGFSVLLFSDIPRMGAEQRNEAWRLVTLVDALYEHGVMLICTAETEPAALYTGGDGSFEFARTISRLREMQSDSYVHREHKG